MTPDGIDGLDCDDVSFWLAAPPGAPRPAGLDDHAAGCATCRTLIAEAERPPLRWLIGVPADALDDRDLHALATVDPIVFEIDRELARGGMGRVLRARDRRLGRDVAIKEVLDIRLQARFEREVAITARLQHPAIVPIYEAGRWPDGAAYYAMRLVSGGTLAAAIARTRTLEDRLALLPHVLALTDALAYAHARRIVHRDLKPGNVLVGEFGETIVIDWGIAKELDAPGAPGDLPELSAAIGDAATVAAPTTAAGLTIAGSVMGTPGFMAPEQAAGAEVDARADVYSLGAILYNLLAGHIPHVYPDDDPDDTTLTPDLVIARALAGPPPALADVAPRVPLDLQVIVERAMARDPAARFGDARELADELRRFTAGQLLRSRDYSIAERALRWVRKHRAVVAAGAVAVAALIGLAAVTVHDARLQRAAAERALAQLQIEQGRQLVVDGHPGQAAALLAAALERLPDDARGLRLAALAVEGAERRIARLPGTAAAFRRDGRALAIARPDAIALIDPATGAVTATIAADHPRDVAYSADGRQLLVVSPASVALIDLVSGLATAAVHPIATGAITTAALIGDRVAVATATEVLVVERDGRVGHRDAIAGVHALDVAPDATRLLGRGPDATYVWSLPDLARVSLPAASSARFDRDGSIVLAEPDQLRRYPSNAPAITLRAGEAQPLTRLGDGRLATGDGLVDADTVRPLPGAVASQLIAGLDADHVITGGFDRSLRIARLDLAQPVAILEASDVPDELRASPTGDRAVSIGHAGAIELWNTAALREPTPVAAFDSPVERLVTAPRTGAIAAWLHDSRNRVAVIGSAAEGRRGWIDGWPVGFRPDGAVLAVNLGGQLAIYAVPDLAQVRVLADAAAIQAAAFSPDGWLATAAAGRINLRDTRTWNVVASFDTGRADITAIALDDHGHVVTGHADGSLGFWYDGARVAVIAGHRAHVEDLAIVGDRAISASWDRTTRAWDVATGASRGVLLPGTGRALAVSPSGALLATIDGATLQIWDARDGRLVEQRPAGPATDGIAFVAEDRVVIGDGPRIRAIAIGAPPRTPADVARLAATLGWRVAEAGLIETPSRP